MINHIPFPHDELHVDPIACEKAIAETIRAEIAEATRRMHSDMVPFVSIANMVLQERLAANPSWKPHWHWYPIGKLVVFTTLRRDESFHDLHDLYESISSRVAQMAPNYRGDGDIVTQPDPEDDTQMGWRQWQWKLGRRVFELCVSFSFSQSCRIEPDGTEIVQKHRVVCSDVAQIQAVPA